MNFFDLVTSSNLVAYWLEKNLNDPTVGAQLFPYKKEIGVELSYIKGANNQPVGLRLSAYDSKSIRRDRRGIEKVSTEMPYFKESMVVDEKMRQQLNTLLQTQNMNLIKNIIARIFDDQIQLITSAYETIERARMQMLTTGTLVLASNGQSYTYDYGMPAENKITVTTSWTSTGADPVKDITDAQATARTKGYKLTRAMCNSNCLNALLNNTNIKNTLYVLAGGNISLTVNDVIRYIEERTGIVIYVNDNGYVDETTGTFTTYFSDDTFVLFPEGELGNTHFGVTPAESDLMTGATEAEVSLVDGAIAVLSHKEYDPVNVETIVSMVMLPSFEQVEGVFVIDTTASSSEGNI